MQDRPGMRTGSQIKVTRVTNVTSSNHQALLRPDFGGILQRLLPTLLDVQVAVIIMREQSSHKVSLQLSPSSKTHGMMWITMTFVVFLQYITDIQTWLILLIPVSSKLKFAKASKYNNDSPSWDMNMNGPFADNCWKACRVELDTLENNMKTWDLVKRTDGMHVLPST